MRNARHAEGPAAVAAQAGAAPMVATPERRRLLCVLGLGATAGGVALAWPGRAQAAQATPAHATGPHDHLQSESRFLMGTRVDLQVSHPDAPRRRLALDSAWAEMLRQSEMMSRYRSASQVSRLAMAAGGAALPVAPELLAVLQQARRVHRASGGRFDPTVGTYADWRFEPGRWAAADPAALRRQQPLVGLDGLQFDLLRGTARLDRPGLQLDLGGIAKLPILAAGLQTLQAHGMARALVNGGGDVLCCSRPGDPPWRIGLRDPNQPDRLAGVLPLSEGVVAASGDYERSFSRQGRRFHHVLDPRTGEPSQGLHGVALVAPQVAAVNGWGPALMLAGGDTARRWLAAGGPLAGVQALLAEPSGRRWTTPGLRLEPVGAG